VVPGLDGDMRVAQSASTPLPDPNRDDARQAVTVGDGGKVLDREHDPSEVIDIQVASEVAQRMTVRVMSHGALMHLNGAPGRPITLADVDAQDTELRLHEVSIGGGDLQMGGPESQLTGRKLTTGDIDDKNIMVNGGATADLSFIRESDAELNIRTNQANPSDYIKVSGTPHTLTSTKSEITFDLNDISGYDLDL